MPPLRFTYIRAHAKVKAIFFFDLLPLTHHCSISTHNGNNATDRKRRRFRIRFRSNINAPLDPPLICVGGAVGRKVSQLQCYCQRLKLASLIGQFTSRLGDIGIIASNYVTFPVDKPYISV